MLAKVKNEILKQVQDDGSGSNLSAIHLSAIHVSCCLLARDDKILVGQRASDAEFYPGLWEFPGGKLETGETPQQALIRELQEELGIVVVESDINCITTTSYDYSNRRIVLHVFKCSKWGGEISDIVHDNLQWVKYEELSQMPLLPANLELLTDETFYLLKSPRNAERLAKAIEEKTYLHKDLIED